jgi:hypothetical protein
MINYVPLLGMIFGAVLLALYFFRQNLKPILLVALVTIMLAGLSGVPAFYSGGSAEDLVEDQAHVSETIIHEHEEAADVTLWVSSAAIGFTARTANLDGKISHPELLDSKDVNQQQINKEKNEKEND